MMANTSPPARWYMLDKDGMATLCTDKADAEREAADAQAAWPHTGPHRAVQLIEADGRASHGQAPAQPDPASAPLSRQQIYDMFSFLEGMVNEWGYRQIVNAAEEIQAQALSTQKPTPTPQAADTGATVPLTKRQISDIYFEALGQERPALIDHGCIERFARLVERHHGIREGGQHG